MRRLAVQTFLSLDGVTQAPGGPEEDPTGGFAHGGWTVNYWDDVMGQVIGEAMGGPFDLLLGRKTYEIFAAHWPYAKDDPFAARLNDATKYVVSSTLKTPTWQNSRIVTGDIAVGVARVRAAAVRPAGSFALEQPTGARSSGGGRWSGSAEAVREGDDGEKALRSAEEASP